MTDSLADQFLDDVLAITPKHCKTQEELIKVFNQKLSIIESFLENHKNKLDENDLQFCYLVRNMTVRELNAVKQGREELISAVEDNISEIRVLRDAES